MLLTNLILGFCSFLVWVFSFLFSIASCSIIKYHTMALSYLWAQIFSLNLVLFASVLEKVIEQARASGWLRSKEMFFTLWLGTPVTLPLLLSRENSSPHPCSGGVKQCTCRWMGLSTPLDSYTQNIKYKIWKTSPEISARYKVHWLERKFCEVRLCSRLCVLFFSLVGR